MPLPESGIAAIDRHFGDGREGLRDANIFITGGTGFFGCCLLGYLHYLEQHYRLDVSATVLTRDRQAFAARYGNDAYLRETSSIRFVEGDVRDFAFPDGTYTHVIHAAHTSAHATFNHEDPLVQFDIACTGTRRVLDFAVQAGVRRFLMLSSGSVYGPVPADMQRTPEEFSGAPIPQDVGAALNHGKRTAEFLCAYYRQRYGLETATARCFTFIGPGLPLDIHYAVGNFIRDALWGEEVIVKGDGRAVRSYMDVTDLLVWLLVMLVRAPSGAVYNVGSDQPVSILELATRVRDLLAPGKPVRVLGTASGNANRNIYVPDISHARTELGLDVWTTLDDAIEATARAALAEQRG